ncbi:hypothetical protein MGM1_1090 [Candidatus Malacoplasma girerdii]|uniref:Uncharacterized protein n=1 Tax=Candidatus Malacoplasma girerdii TaxID=1318617 RepID=A0A097SSE1_9BACT|nr:hypothetical protein MGM1_1090 [Candidatus Malacoplasma girerdii]ASJ89139.1 MAG: hypothetical protein B1217_0245 [Candidatus Malacoplasma girerdii]
MKKIYNTIKENTIKNPKDKSLRLPKFMMVVVGSEFGYMADKIDDCNIYIVPISALKY